PTLQEQTAIRGGIVRIFAVEERNRSTRIIHIPDNGVLIDAGATTIGGYLMIHDIPEIVPRCGVGRDSYAHYRCVIAIDRRNAKRTARAEGRQPSTNSGRAIEILEVFADGGPQIAIIEIPLAGDVGYAGASQNNCERPGVGE